MPEAGALAEQQVVPEGTLPAIRVSLLYQPWVSSWGWGREEIFGVPWGKVGFSLASREVALPGLGQPGRGATRYFPEASKQGVFTSDGCGTDWHQVDGLQRQSCILSQFWRPCI